MKNLLIIISIFLLASCGEHDEYHYTGSIVSKGYEAPTSGYKSSRDPVYFIMMREDKSGKVIRVNVTIPAWHSLKEGDRTGFVLSNLQLFHLGNTTDYTKNLYEQ